MLNERLPVIQWETCAAEIANRINDLPLAIGNIVSDFEIIDLITPNRLKLGRNNDKSPSGCVKKKITQLLYSFKTFQSQQFYFTET